MASEGSLLAPPIDKSYEDNCCLQDAVYAFNQWPIKGAIFLSAAGESELSKYFMKYLFEEIFL